MVVSKQLVPQAWARLLQAEDAAALAAAYRRNRNHLEPWEPARGPSYFTEQGQRNDIRRKLRELDLGLAWPLVITDGDEIIGTLTLMSIARGALQSANVGYWVDQRHVGRGIATASLRWAAELAQQDLSLHRLQAGTLLHNVASQAVLRRVGFTEIGVAERYIKIAGRWQDHLLHQLLLE